MMNEVVHKLEVEVQGNTFYSKEVRKVMTRAFEPMTFIQTDKPIYLPGQTGNLELIFDAVHIMVPCVDGFPLQNIANVST